MFKKVQMKFFAIITSILLAVFIAVLASINLIMEAVMQRQSQVVLNQIAAGVEYNEKSSTFTFTPADDFPHKDDPVPPPPTTEKTTEATNVAEGTGTLTTTTTAVTTSVKTTTTAEPSTQEPTQDNTQQQEPSSETGTVVTDTPTAPPVHTTVQQEMPPVVTTRPPYNNDEPYPPSGGWQNDRPEWEKPDYEGNEWERPREDDFCYPRPEDYYYWNWYCEDNVKVEGDEPEWCPDNECTYNGSEDDFRRENAENKSADASDESGVTVLSANRRAAAVLDGYTIINTPVRTYNETLNFDQRRGEPVPKSLGSIDFFIIMADNNGKFVAAMNNDDLDEDVAQTYISAIMKEDAAHGMVNNFQFCRSDKSNGTLMVFTDKQAEIEMLDQLTRTTILIGIVTFVILSVLAYFFSKKSIEPIKIAFDKQKQFISDASHELKTPLTVISANADVLSDEIGENKWLEYIKAQTERMNVLVNDLLNLTRLENNTSDFVCGEFNLSQAITNTALPFECQAFETNKVFEVDVEDGIVTNGSEKHIKQMTAIFIDNALKYSNNGGTVRVTLRSHGDKSILSVFNTGSGLKEEDKGKIFERFYRSDDSRSRMTGGYGLGLAIAKSIIDKHKFRINVDNHEGESVCFNIIM